jgi:chromosome segregation ATPase
VSERVSSIGRRVPGANAEDADPAILAQLADQAEQAARRERQLREYLHDAHVQLAERDDQIGRLIDPRRPTRDEVFKLVTERDDLLASQAAVIAERTRLLAERERLSSDLAEVRAAFERSERELVRISGQHAALKSTRAWRTAGTWWRLRDRLRGR